MHTIVTGLEGPIHAIQAYTDHTMPEGLRDTLDKILMMSGIPDMEGVTKPIKDLNEDAPAVHVVGTSNSHRPIAHIAACLTPAFGGLSGEDVGRLIQLRGAVTKENFRRNGVMRTITRVLLEKWDSLEIRELLLGKGIDLARANTATRQPIFMAQTGLLWFAEGIIRLTQDPNSLLRFSTDTTPVRQITGPTNQVILQLDGEGPGAFVVSLVGTSEILELQEGKPAPMRHTERRVYPVHSMEGVRALIKDLVKTDRYEGRIPTGLDNPHVVALVQHPPEEHTPILHYLGINDPSSVNPKSIFTIAFERVLPQQK